MSLTGDFAHWRPRASSLESVGRTQYRTRGNYVVEGVSASVIDEQVPVAYAERPLRAKLKVQNAGKLVVQLCSRVPAADISKNRQRHLLSEGNLQPATDYDIRPAL